MPSAPPGRPLIHKVTLVTGYQKGDPIHDLAAVRLRAERARNFGYMGTLLIHPSHVQLANEVFGPSQVDSEYWKELVEAVEAGERRGTSAVLYQGAMMDIAHLNHAREMLKLAQEYSEKPPV